MAFESAPEERSAWIMLALAVIGYPTYLVVLFVGGAGKPLVESEFAWPMVWTIIGSIVLSMVLHGVFQVFQDLNGRTKRDERDRTISRFADHTGNAFIVIGALAGLVLAMFRADAFWIANAIFLGFFVSAVFGSLAKIAAYRTGMPREW